MSNSKKTQSEEDKLKSLLIIVLGFLVLHFVFRKKETLSAVFLQISLWVGILSLTFPFVKNGVLWTWEKIAHVLGWINTRILLSLVFYVFLMPIAFIARLWSKNMLHLKQTNESMYVNRNHLYTSEDLENTW